MSQQIKFNKPSLLSIDAIEDDFKQNNCLTSVNYKRIDYDLDEDHISHSLIEAKNFINFNNSIENSSNATDNKIDLLTNNLNSLKNFIQLTKQIFFNK
jgi:hypothetical protein